LYLYARTSIEETYVEELSIRALKYNHVTLADLEEYCKDEKMLVSIVLSEFS